VGVEKNLYIRNHIQDLIYSKDKIVINFIDTDYSDDSRRNLGEPSLRDDAERDSARSSTQAVGGIQVDSDSVNKNGFEKILVAEHTKQSFNLF
jgi:hypothetical protein